MLPQNLHLPLHGLGRNTNLGIPVGTEEEGVRKRERTYAKREMSFAQGSELSSEPAFLERPWGKGVSVQCHSCYQDRENVHREQKYSLILTSEQYLRGTFLRGQDPTLTKGELSLIDTFLETSDFFFLKHTLSDLGRY